MAINGTGKKIGNGRYYISNLQNSNLKKNQPLINVFQKYDIDNDGIITMKEAMMFLVENNQDGNVEFSRKEFGALEKDFGDMGSDERKVLNNDFLTAVFGTDDVVITTEGNKQTFKTSDGNFLGTVEQDENTFKIFNKDGALANEVTRTDDSFIVLNYSPETHRQAIKVTYKEGSKVVESYDDNGNLSHKKTTMEGSEVTEYYDDNGNVFKKVTHRPGLGTETRTRTERYTVVVTYEGDALIASKDGIIKEEYYNPHRTDKRVTYVDGRVEYFRRNGLRDEYELDFPKSQVANDQITNPKTPAEASNAQQEVKPETPAGTQNTQQVVNSETKTPNFTDSLQQFGNKVTIDEGGSTQRLNSDKQWETSVKVPQRAITEENGAPSEIQIKLPSIYGDNQYQTLKLIDSEKNVYQDSSGVRKFQVNISEDGITLKHIEISDANTSAFVEANKPVVNGIKNFLRMQERFNMEKLFRKW